MNDPGRAVPGRRTPPNRRRRIRTWLAPGKASRALRLAGAACACTLAAAAVAPAPALAGAPQPITAQLQQPGEDTSADLIHLAGRALHASPGYFYVQGQATTLAYSLDPRRPVPTAATTWHAVHLNTAGLHGVATALWLLNGRLPGRPLPGDLEGAARQIAIWAKGDGFPIVPATVPDGPLRRRALLLARAAPSSYPASQQPTALALSAFVQHVSGGTVDVLIDVADDMEDTFDQPQRIDLRVDGRWTTLRTDSRFDINPAQRGEALASHRSGLAPDDNTAIARISGVTGVTQFELFWNVDLGAGIAMMPDGDAPAIVTADPIKLGLSDVLDAGTASPASGSGPDWPLGLAAGWLSALLAAVGLWLTSRRKPTLRAAWNTYEGAIEVADVTVVAGRRPIELHEIGLVFSWGSPRHRQRHHLRGPTRRDLPVLLQDGASAETSFELGAAIDDLYDAVGEPRRLVAVARPYVRASGREFRGRILAGTPWARLRQLAGSARPQRTGTPGPPPPAGPSSEYRAR